MLNGGHHRSDPQLKSVSLILTFSPEARLRMRIALLLNLSFLFFISQSISCLYSLSSSYLCFCCRLDWLSDCLLLLLAIVPNDWGWSFRLRSPVCMLTTEWRVLSLYAWPTACTDAHCPSSRRHNFPFFLSFQVWDQPKLRERHAHMEGGFIAVNGALNLLVNSFQSVEKFLQINGEQSSDLCMPFHEILTHALCLCLTQQHFFSSSCFFFFSFPPQKWTLECVLCFLLHHQGPQCKAWWRNGALSEQHMGERGGKQEQAGQSRLHFQTAGQSCEERREVSNLWTPLSTCMLKNVCLWK